MERRALRRRRWEENPPFYTPAGGGGEGGWSRHVSRASWGRGLDASTARICRSRIIEALMSGWDVMSLEREQHFALAEEWL
uniref:Uncharacterized protein n=1 Tax=Oryza meridionalis TaxID=40149 RepID=A0A0E0F0F1_9ORYZ